MWLHLENKSSSLLFFFFFFHFFPFPPLAVFFFFFLRWTRERLQRPPTTPKAQMFSFIGRIDSSADSSAQSCVFRPPPPFFLTPFSLLTQLFPPLPWVSSPAHLKKKKLHSVWICPRLDACVLSWLFSRRCPLPHTCSFPSQLMEVSNC